MREYLFEKKIRLLKSEEYLNLRKKSKRLENTEFYLIFKKNQYQYSRIGLTVSKRIGNAVVRNRIKRIIRDYFRKNRHLIKINIDINMIAKKSAAGKTNRELFESLKNIFYKIENGKIY